MALVLQTAPWTDWAPDTYVKQINLQHEWWFQLRQESMLTLWSSLISGNKDEVPSPTDLLLVKLIPPGPQTSAETIYAPIYKKEFT